MHGPVSPGWLLVALCAATGAYCLLRMRSTVEEQRRAAGGEALMGFGMAAMAVPAALFSPPSWAWPVYAGVFAAAALRALWAARTDRHHVHHLLGTSAMVYMAVVMALSPGHHHEHGGPGVPPVTGALLLYFVGYVLLSGARLVPASAVTTGHVSMGNVSTASVSTGNVSTGGFTTGTVSTDAVVSTEAGVTTEAVGWGDRPELARACRLSMAIAMVTMLLTL